MYMLNQVSHIRLFAIPWTVGQQASLTMGFSRQEYWSGLPCPPPGELPNPGIEPRSPTLQADSLPSEPPGKPQNTGVGILSLLQGNFPTQESNWVFLHCRQILSRLSCQGSSGRREWQLTPVFLPGEFRGQKSLVGYSPKRRKELEVTEAIKHACLQERVSSGLGWGELRAGIWTLTPRYSGRDQLASLHGSSGLAAEHPASPWSKGLWPLTPRHCPGLSILFWMRGSSLISSRLSLL